MTKNREDRWQSRPVFAASLRFVVFAGPIVAAAVGAALVIRSFPGDGDFGSTILRWGVALLTSVLLLIATDRVGRRLLPLAVLLRLDLAFPNAAPSRFKVARSAANLKGLEERVRIARTTGFADEPSRAAEMILSLVAAVEAHDRATRGHAERVRIYTDLIAEQMHLPQQDRDRLRWAALLHDVGKLEVPRSVLNKAGPLEPGELEIVRRHPEEGARLTSPLHEWLGDWAAAIEQHHERWDGRGYPYGFTESEIALGARIIAVADVYETMTASRPYHRPKTPARARQELVHCAGSQFDPAIVRTFLDVSTGRLRAASGRLSWLAQNPLVRGLEGVTGLGGRIGTGALLVVGVLAVAAGRVIG
jgi:putative nucleotidyltransferase with HDIG domain